MLSRASLGDNLVIRFTASRGKVLRAVGKASRSVRLSCALGRQRDALIVGCVKRAGVCCDEPDPGKKLSWMPLDLAYDPAGPFPCLPLILELDKLDFHFLGSTSSRTTIKRLDKGTAPDLLYGAGEKPLLCVQVFENCWNLELFEAKADNIAA